MVRIQVLFFLATELCAMPYVENEIKQFMAEKGKEILQMKNKLKSLEHELELYTENLQKVRDPSDGILLEGREALEEQQKRNRLSNEEIDNYVHDRQKRRDYVNHELKVVAFQSYITQATNLVLHAGSQLVFDYVRTNIGNGYSKYNGVFTAPKSGCYVFTWHIRCQSCNIPTKLYVRGNIAGSINAISSDDGYDSPTGISVVVLSTGDPVAVRTDNGFNPSGGFKSNHWHYSTFSGWLVG